MTDQNAMTDNTATHDDVQAMTAPSTLSSSIADWLAHHEAARAAGLTTLDALCAQSLPDGRVRLISHITAPDASRHQLITAEVASGESVPSLVNIYANAPWYEREAAELVGAAIANAAEHYPLFITDGSHPLQRESALTRRIAEPWPGIYEPGESNGDSTSRRAKRRPKPPPGIRPEWLAQ